MPQTAVKLMDHGEFRLPIELAKGGLLNAANHLKKYGYLTLLSHIDSLPPLLPLPSTMESQRASGYSDVIRREGFLARRRIARAVLSMVLDVPAEAIEISEGENGQPLPKEPSGAFHLSFAARGKLALIGIATRAIGVDLEIAEPDMLIPWNMLRADERALLEKLPENERTNAFCTLWTAKEALVKALGLGFRMPPEAIHIAGWTERGALAVAGFDAPPGDLKPWSRQWHLKTCRNLVVAELTGGLVVGAACIARSSRRAGNQR